MTAVAVRSGGATRLAGVASVAVSVATAIALLGLSVALFFNPLWVAFEQDRTRADAWTGYTPDQVHAVTNDVLREVYVGPATFLQQVDGAPVFRPDERGHMADVHGVVVLFFGLALLAALVVVATALATRRPAWWWRAVARGAALLAIGAAVVGAYFLLFFDQAFTIFHEIFFAGGNWSFDPRVDRLVQLFPYDFWTETSVAIAIVGVVLTTLTWAYARRRAAAMEP